ncbi:MAG: D-cysteine desulfhydrase family protein [Rhodobacteraceae bacterium]|nr:D-cysteine desulfhydrase family protein [Paracoccaceae bacterium]
MDLIQQLLSPFPRADLLSQPTPLERLKRMSDKLGIDLWIKRDDLTGLSFGGNKTRQLEYYFGEALAKNADTILITGAVQSNYVRTAGTVASMFGMKAVLQLEERVKGMGPQYYSSGNVLLGNIIGAEHMSFPEGEDEAGADAALHDRAEALQAEGRTPYVIHLGMGHPPLGSLGYIQGGAELAGQMNDFDVAVVPSGSGATHAGYLTGLRLAGVNAQVYGICVRRDAAQQSERLERLTHSISDLIDIKRPFGSAAIQVRDDALAPGYGQMGAKTRSALELMIQTEGILLDPVYSGKTFAGLLELVNNGTIQTGEKVVMLHTGGQLAVFAYQESFLTQR